MKTLANWFDGCDIKIPTVLTLKFKKPSGKELDTIVKESRKRDKLNLYSPLHQR